MGYGLRYKHLFEQYIEKEGQEKVAVSCLRAPLNCKTGLEILHEQSSRVLGLAIAAPTYKSIEGLALSVLRFLPVIYRGSSLQVHPHLHFFLNFYGAMGMCIQMILGVKL
ncbi:uncharacterized protein LOC131144405 [Malania oleifera]|uniref:uncharacterized protein LOC131144405 n=1 Tax=Malania oleifera TaxID=397392 RepID=UPI0025AE96E7|nr:uncharacterized protein LOC131144405 [Malania oleifera]